MTFDLQQELMNKPLKVQRQVYASSVSEVVRYAISVFDFSGMKLIRPNIVRSLRAFQQAYVSVFITLRKKNKVSVDEIYMAL